MLEWTETYWQEKWSSLEPSSRSEAARYLNRTRQHFVDVVPTDEEAAALRRDDGRAAR